MRWKTGPRLWKQPFRTKTYCASQLTAARRAGYCYRSRSPASTRNYQRPHRSLPPHRQTRLPPTQARACRPPLATGPGTPTTASAPIRSRPSSTVTLRHAGKLHHIGVEPPGLAGQHGPAARQDLSIRVIHATTGELLRELTLNPERDYQAHGRPPEPRKRNHRDPNAGSRCPRCLATSQWWQVSCSNQRRLSRRF